MNLLAQAQTQPEMITLLQQNPDLVPTFLSAMLLALILSVPLVMAIWFAPALVYFRGLRPLKAMSLSIKACNKNLLPFLVFGLIFIPLLLLAIVPFGLGLLVILPVMLISQFVSFQAVFPDTDSENDDTDSGVLTL